MMNSRTQFQKLIFVGFKGGSQLNNLLQKL
uniref:Uncharacterized protein n=1 Tax=Rhizophora mucronata TaxID=61149 RepID=A0A2P2PFV6_RHIMU